MGFEHLRFERIGSELLILYAVSFLLFHWGRRFVVGVGVMVKRGFFDRKGLKGPLFFCEEGSGWGSGLRFGMGFGGCGRGYLGLSFDVLFFFLFEKGGWT